VALVQSLALLIEVGVVPSAALRLDSGSVEAARSLREAVIAEIPAFSTSNNPHVLPELDAHAIDHIREIRRLFGGGDVGAFAFVRAHAQRRAEQRFPLEATLHAYRCGHKVLSRWMRDAAIASTSVNGERAVAGVADFSIEYTNAISTIAAAEYVLRTRILAEAEGDRRAELLNLLLRGYDESDERVGRLLKRAGYLQQRQSYCVVLAQSTDPLEMNNPSRVQRMIEAIATASASASIRTLVGTRNNVVTAVFSDTRRISGWTAPQSRLAERIQAALMVLGPAVLIGISADQPSTAFIPNALREATVALDFASVTERVVQYSGLSVRRLLLHRAGSHMQSSAPPWSSALTSADEKSRGALIQTARALADADLNVQKAARALELHPNTIYARIERIQQLTGLDCQRYHDLTDLLLALDCSRDDANH
jgi:hypothetical protein